MEDKQSNDSSSKNENQYPVDEKEMKKFHSAIADAKYVAVLTGAGVSAESGVPTFRGAGGYWRKWQAQDLATPQAFSKNPSLIWEFYHYRRETVSKCKPNRAHLALAAFEKRMEKEKKKFILLTQNIDRLHHAAGSKNIVEIHGTLWVTRCTQCLDERENRKIPMCAALEGKGAPNPEAQDASIPLKDLPSCEKCGGLLRPAVVWFNENLNEQIMQHVNEVLSQCDLFLVIGTSSVVYPAALFAPRVSQRGVEVAEFNIETTPATSDCTYAFQGKCGDTLPSALEISEEELKIP